jgi:hypothetical protein
MKNDKNTSCLSRLFLSPLCLLLIFSCPGAPSARADDRIVTVGVYENAPKIFTSESGKPAGIFVDIIEQIAKIEGWNLRYVSGTWGDGLLGFRLCRHL